MVSYLGYKLVAELQKKDLKVLLTGGAVLEALSGRTFETGDWDLVPGPEGNFEKISKALKKKGYKKLGNTWYLQTEKGLENPGELIQSKYPWGKTLTVEVGSLKVETVAPEWLFVDRVKKCRSSPRFCEQALFLLQTFALSENYNWDEELVETIATHKKIPERFLKKDWLEKRAGKQS